MFKEIRSFIKLLTRSTPEVHKALAFIYHETRFNLSRIILSYSYPDLQIVRYKNIELENQRQQGFQSQFGQDFFIEQFFFKYKNKGTFVDIGCNHPKIMNNSFYFEKKSWTGLAFDPIATYKFLWGKNRTAVFLSFALGAKKSLQSFTEIKNEGGWRNRMSGMSKNVRHEDKLYGYKTYKVSVERGASIFYKYRLKKNIDFVSIDVEGSEMDVIQGFDMPTFLPRVILIENCQGLSGEKSIRDFLIKKGYIFYARIWCTDDVFFHPKLIHPII